MRKWTTIAASACAFFAAAPLAAQQAQTSTTTTTETKEHGKAPVIHRVSTDASRPEVTTTTTETTTTAEAPPTVTRRSHMRESIVEVESSTEPNYVTPFGMSITAGGGPTGMLEPEARHMTNVGGGWDARLTIGTRSILGLELGYIGSAQRIDAIGLDTNALLLKNGAEAVARLNIVNGPVQPYLLGGAGWTNFRLTNTVFNNSDVSSVDNMAHFPVGAGVGFRIRGLVIDTRGVFRPTVGDNMLQAEGGRLHTWEGKVMGGWEF